MHLAEDAVNKLQMFVNNHRLFQSDYLKHFSTMAFVNKMDGVRQFSTEHYLHSRHFRQYLDNVLQNVEDREITSLLQKRIIKDIGIYSPEDLEVLASNGVR